MGEHKSPNRSRIRVTLDSKQVGPLMPIEKAKFIERWLTDAGVGLIDWMEGEVMKRFLAQAEDRDDALVVQVFESDSRALVILKADLLTDTEESLKARIGGASERILAERERLLERKT